MNGKGDKQRPLKIDTDKFEKNWDAIFGKERKGMPTNEQIEMVFSFEGDNKKQPPEGG